MRLRSDTAEVGGDIVTEKLLEVCRRWDRAVAAATASHLQREEGSSGKRAGGRGPAATTASTATLTSSAATGGGGATGGVPPGRGDARGDARGRAGGAVGSRMGRTAAPVPSRSPSPTRAKSGGPVPLHTAAAVVGAAGALRGLSRSRLVPSLSGHVRGQSPPAALGGRPTGSALAAVASPITRPGGRPGDVSAVRSAGHSGTGLTSKRALGRTKGGLSATAPAGTGAVGAGGLGPGPGAGSGVRVGAPASAQEMAHMLNFFASPSVARLAAVHRSGRGVGGR
jgi:hypothetical protein